MFRRNRTFRVAREISLQRAAVRGRGALFLSSISVETESAFLSERVRELTSEISTLRSQIDPDNATDRLSAALLRESYRITDVATSLELEHAPAPVRLDLRSLRQS
jgi:hypothetical protein